MEEKILHESLDRASKWLRVRVEPVTNVKKLSYALIALTDSGDEKFGHNIQRIANKIKNSQDTINNYRFGSWNGEMWDTAHALIAINRASMDPYYITDSPIMKNGLNFIQKQWNKTNLNNWSDYLSETIACSRAIIEVRDQSHYDNVKDALDWLVSRKCQDGSFVSIKYTAQIISVLSSARDELSYDEHDDSIESGIKFLRTKINEPDLGILSEPWMASQIVSGLLDAGLSRDDPDVLKCCDSILTSQDKAENGGSWLHSIIRTTNCMTSISKILGPKKIQKRRERFWTRVTPNPGRLTWSWTPEINTESDEIIGKGMAKIEAPDKNLEIQKIVEIPQDQFNISLINDVKKKFDVVSEISTRSIRNKRGNAQQSEPISSEPNLLHDVVTTMQEAGNLLYKNILTIRGRDDTFGGLLAKKQIGHLSILTEGSQKLNSIPWELIYDKDNFTCLKYALGRTITNNYEYDQEEDGHKLKVLLVGDPTETLPGVEKELDVLKSGLESDGDDVEIKKIYGKGITREKFFEELSEGNYDIIHFAGHADFKDDKSYLLFRVGNGESEDDRKIVVGAQEIANQIENCRIKPKIVFMNACSSAAQNNQLDSDYLSYDKDSSNIALNFVDSLSDVHISAYVGALWPVHDEEAAEFAVGFYKNLRKGCTIGDAVRLARIESFLNDPDELTWASFVLYGTPTMKILQKTTPHTDDDTKPLHPYEISNVDATQEFKLKSDKIIELLSDPKFEYRKLQTLLRKSGMSDEEFEKFLELYPQVKLSSLPAVDGSPLYRLDKSRYSF